MKQHVENQAGSNYPVVKGKGYMYIFNTIFVIVYFLPLQQLMPQRTILRAHQTLPKYLETFTSNYLGISQKY